MSLKRNNLAELLPIGISGDELKHHWETFILTHKDSITWDFRVFLTTDMFEHYFKMLIESINDVVKEVPKYYMLQIFDQRLYPHKGFLNVIHKDVDRNSCITLPLSYNMMEPVLFYNDIPGISPEQHRKTSKPWPEKPQQIARYSENHPTLVNVQNLHNVRVLDETSPRVLLQLSFDIGFDDMINKNPSIWRII